MLQVHVTGNPESGDTLRARLRKHLLDLLRWDDICQSEANSIRNLRVHDPLGWAKTPFLRGHPSAVEVILHNSHRDCLGVTVRALTKLPVDVRSSMFAETMNLTADVGGLKFVDVLLQVLPGTLATSIFMSLVSPTGILRVTGTTMQRVNAAIQALGKLPPWAAIVHGLHVKGPFINLPLIVHILNVQPHTTSLFLERGYNVCSSTCCCRACAVHVRCIERLGSRRQ